MRRGARQRAWKHQPPSISTKGKTIREDSLPLTPHKRTFTEMKLAWHSLATAFASSVLPQPGGP